VVVVADRPLAPDDLRCICKRDLCRLERAAIGDADDHVLGDVNEAAREVAGVCGAERSVGQALACSVC